MTLPIIVTTIFCSGLVAVIVVLFYNLYKDKKNDEQRIAEWRERKRLKKLRAQEEHDALLSIKDSLEKLASRQRTSKT